jgi:hypothetical protein
MRRASVYKAAIVFFALKDVNTTFFVCFIEEKRERNVKKKKAVSCYLIPLSVNLLERPSKMAL